MKSCYFIWLAIGKTEFVLDLAIRIIVYREVCLPYQEEQRKLIELQEQEGSWPADALFNDGRILHPKQYYGNRALSTAFALRALIDE